MGELRLKKQAKVYDVVIVESGAGGGMAVYVLANAGLKVCLMEAGPDFYPAKNASQLKNLWDSPTVVLVLSLALLAILTPAIGDGIFMANLILQ